MYSPYLYTSSSAEPLLESGSYSGGFSFTAIEEEKEATVLSFEEEATYVFSFGRRESLRGNAFDGPSEEEIIGLFGTFGEKPGESACMSITEQAIDERDNTDNDSLLVDSGASGHYLDRKFTRGLKERMVEYEELRMLRKILVIGASTCWRNRYAHDSWHHH